MANDIQDTVRQLLISAIEGAGKRTNGAGEASGGNGLSGVRGLAAGVGAAALAPVAIKGLGKLVREMGIEGLQDAVKAPGKAVQGLTSDVGDHVGSGIGDKISDKVDESGGPAGILKDTLKGALPFGGGGGDATKGGGLGIGKKRRMPVQQSVDIGAPLEVVYNQWTQFEDWPNFMHRVTRVTQEDDSTVSFTTKIWGRTKEFKANIETQRPNERIKWRVSEGISHAGVVSFHEIGTNLTRVLLALDVDPGFPLEKAARGMRHIKRAARGDLHRLKAFIEMAENETGAWRGVIEDGEVVEEHDPSYDEQREYSDPEAFTEDSEDDDAADESGDDDDEAQDAEPDEDAAEDEDEPEANRPRRKRQTSANGDKSDEGSSTRSRRSDSGAGGRTAAARRSSGTSRTASASRRSPSKSGSGSGRSASKSGSSGSSKQPSSKSASGSGGSSKQSSSKSGSGGSSRRSSSKSASGSGGSSSRSSGSGGSARKTSRSSK
jgi:uncharacterized membrane protein